MRPRGFAWLLLVGFRCVGSAGMEADGYTEPGVCATCHAKIAETYRLTGMARSFYQPALTNQVENFSKGNPFFQKKSETWYAMRKREGRLYQERWRVGPDGKPLDVQEQTVDYVMGSGNHVRTYLHRTVRNTLIELPLAWYSERGGFWGMNPGHDRSSELPPRTVAYECMACHNAYPKIPPGHEEPGSEYVYQDSLPQGIDCQRCHGPGANHVKAATAAGASVQQVRSSIVNPARLSTERQLEVCMQCHLETVSQGLPHSIRRYGRGPFSYRPGEPLGDAQLFFDRVPDSGHEDDFEIAHSAYRLRKSKCFLESGGAGGKAQLTCTTCHNPHDIPRGAAAETHYNGVCQQCHAAKLRTMVASGVHTAASTCTGCHMPKRRTMDVVNALMTDHLIARRPPSGDLLGPLVEKHDEVYRGAVIPYYPSSLSSGENVLYRAIAQTTQSNNLRAGLELLAGEMAKQQPGRPEYYLELGQAWLTAGNKGNAVLSFEEALRREPTSPVAMLNLGDALSQSGRVAEARIFLRQSVTTMPGDPLLWYQLGLAESEAGRPADAIAALEKALTLDPDFAEGYSELGSIQAAQGDLRGAETSLRTAVRIQPDLVDALSIFGQVLAARQNLSMAAYYLQRAVRLKPSDAELRAQYDAVRRKANEGAK